MAEDSITRLAIIRIVKFADFAERFAFDRAGEAQAAKDWPRYRQWRSIAAVIRKIDEPLQDACGLH